MEADLTAMDLENSVEILQRTLIPVTSPAVEQASTSMRGSTKCACFGDS